MEENTDSQYDHWVKQLESEEKAHKEFRNQAKGVEQRYADEEKSEGSRFNILWSNTETIKAAVYAKTPAPDVRRRYKDPDPIARQVAEVIERALEYCLDAYDFDGEAQNALRDFLVPGLGQARLRYVPYFQKGEAPKIPLMAEEAEEEGEDGEIILSTRYYNGDERVGPEQVMEDEEGPFIMGEPEDELAYEEVLTEQVPYSRFRWQPADRWPNVMWCAIDHFLTKEEVKEQFGDEVAKNVPYGYSEEGEKLSEEQDGKTRTLFHEIFDKKNRKVIILCKGYNKLIDEVEDPLDLEDFYPFPKPLMATMQSGKLTPKADYLFYQDQAMELDRLSQRIDKLTEELKYRGIYDGSFDRLADIAGAGDGEFLPVDDFMERFEGKASLDAVIKTMPLEELQQVIVALHKAREQVKQTIYEITGIADIVRGQSKASETLGAQRIKGQFATMRIDVKRAQVAKFLRDLLRLKAEIICEHFTPQTLSIMTGIEVTKDMKAMMQSDALRGYKIDIETDSTVVIDQEAQQKSRVEAVQAITGFIEKAAPMIQMGALPPEMAKEILLFVARSFKDARQLEETLEQMGQQPQGLPAPAQSPAQGPQGPGLQMIEGGQNGSI